MKHKKKLLKDQRILLALVILLIVAVVSIINPRFIAVKNLITIFQQISVIGILTMAMSMLLIGGGIGGFLAGLLGMTQYVVSTPGFISFAAYITPAEMGGGFHNLIVSMIVMVIAVAISFAVTYILGKRAEKK